MKILHLIRGGDSGGAKTHIFTLLDELKKYAECEVVCLIPGVFYQEILNKDIKTVLFKQRSRFDLTVVKKIEKLIEEEGIDVLHVHGAMANFIAQFLKKRINIPIVTTMHSDYKLDFDTFFKKIVFTTLNAISLRKIDYFIAVSDNFKDMLIERKFRPNGIYTVYNGMEFANVPKTVTSREEFAKNYGIEIEEGVTYVGIAARFDAVKGVDTFIEGAKKLYDRNPDVRFLIAGDGEQKEYLLNLTKKLGMEKVIKFLGFVTDIYGFWNFIDINCLTSHCESFPYSMLEGAAFKKPMVASDVGGISGLVKNGKTGFLFEAKDADDFAEKLERVVNDDALRHQMGENIYTLATTNFSAETFAKTHIGIYEDILNDFPNKKKYDFIISGYYGYKNSGDDALLLALISEMKARKKNVKIAVLSANPRETKRVYRVDSFGRFNPFVLYDKIRKSKVLLSGGGSLMQDETSSKSLWYYTFILKFAKKMGLKVMQVANGIGPIRRKGNRKLASRVMNSSVDRITLREERSLSEAENMGIKVPTIVTADPAMILEGSAKEEIRLILDEEGIPQGKYVCISMRDWKKNPPDFEEKLAEVCDYLTSELGLNVVFVPMQYPADMAISERIAAKMKNGSYMIRRRLSVGDMIGVIRDAEMVMAMRLHTLIYGVSMNTPVVAIKYDPKVDGFMEYLKQKYYVDLEGLSAEELKQYSKECVNSGKNAESERLCAEMKQKARQNVEFALELLN